MLLHIPDCPLVVVLSSITHYYLKTRRIVEASTGAILGSSQGCQICIFFKYKNFKKYNCKYYMKHNLLNLQPEDKITFVNHLSGSISYLKSQKERLFHWALKSTWKSIYLKTLNQIFQKNDCWDKQILAWLCLGLGTSAAPKRGCGFRGRGPHVPILLSSLLTGQPGLKFCVPPGSLSRAAWTPPPRCI